jgi:AmmeMemoRadiSam system protein B
VKLIRPPAVAGTFYPADPDELRRAIVRSFADAVRPADDAPVPKALVVPHAGYAYSGPIAASAYLRVVPAHDRIHRVVLVGPCHRVYLDGLAVPQADAFDTPFGELAVDTELRSAVRHLPGVAVDDEPHLDEHSLEVQLPFLGTVLDDFTILPIVVGRATAQQVATVLGAVWGGPETLIVISTDLSHYHRYEVATRLDTRTAAAIVARDTDAIADLDACGARPLRGALRVACARDLRVEQLDLRNSGDTAGDHQRVVGYGAFAVG